MCFAYSLLGKTMPEGGPYRIPGFDDSYRHLFKWAFTVGVGIDDKTDPNSAFSKAILDAGLQPEKGLAEKVMSAFWNHHEPIREFFQTSGWAKLQKFESEVALSVISQLVEKDIPVIPLHDGFVVPRAHKNDLHTAMETATAGLSARPIIREVY